MSGKTDTLSGLMQALMPYPGRSNHVLRALVSCTAVVIISQSLQVPLLALSLITVFFVTQTNVVVTKLTGLFFILGSTAAIAVSLLILKITWDVPFLRIMAAFSVFFASVFLMRTSRIGVIFFVVAIVAIYTQSLVDSTPDADLLVRGILWVWVAVNYPIAVTLLVNTLLMPAEPHKQLMAAIDRQLALVIRQLDPAAANARRTDDANRAGSDAQSLYRLLRYAAMRDTTGEFNDNNPLALVTMVCELRAASCQLPEYLTGEHNVTSARRLQEALRHVQAMAHGGQPLTTATDAPADSEYPPLNLMWRILHAAPQQQDASGAKADSRQAAAAAPFLIDDAFSNPRYVIFALKTLLSAVLCYLFYTATDWAGIHTIMLSCLIVAQPGLGNTQRKIILRFTGAAIGSLLALIAIVFITPHVDSLFGLLGIVLPILAISSWISAGPERISYAGIQIMFTFSLAVLESFGPVVNLTEVRDRLVGIILGIAVAGIVHATISPEREGEIMLSRLAKLIDSLKNWLHSPAEHQQGRTPAFMALTECEDLAARVALEPSWRSAEGTHDALLQKGHEILNIVKNMLIETDKLAFSMEKVAADPSSEIRQQAMAIVSQYERNLALIQRILSGDADPVAGDDVVYPPLAPALPAPFRESALALEESQRHFFDLAIDRGAAV
ncbi:hypothetical protein AO703_09990 [[Enterobacter] lignolyticus]|uniref:Integral membrane bound transporter domain-containing protein n=2 Tax=[Enterobacter] lignolyticus TaxID=1334193 RepID=A0A806X530_9ENTR|nr:hypothetical protein AO703_09990 [[Enterobacter] lignolyticus]